jgi:hypothetical protein
VWPNTSRERRYSLAVVRRLTLERGPKRLMAAHDLDEQLDVIWSNLDESWHDQSSPTFHDAFRRLELIVQQGEIDAAEGLAEILANWGPLHDAAAAYKWYYIALSQRGYKVAFQDENHTPPYYCGPVGDFRNEDMVCELVVELGLERIRKLDEEAAAWLAAHG